MSFNFLFGDSIANPLLGHVLKLYNRNYKPGEPPKKLTPDKHGASAGGATAKAIYNVMVKWKNSSFYTPMKDAVVVLSTGWSNSSGNYRTGTDFKTYGEWDYIEKQFQFLKNEGARVFVMGVYSPPNPGSPGIKDNCPILTLKFFTKAGEGINDQVVKQRFYDEYQKANKWLYDKCQNYGFVFEEHSGGNTLLSSGNKGGYYQPSMTGDLHPGAGAHWNSMKPYVPAMSAEWEEWNKSSKKVETPKISSSDTGSKWDYIFGDSIATGLANSNKLNRNGAMKDSRDNLLPSSKDSKGESRVGAPPTEILGYLKNFGAGGFDGKVVVLSTGYSNGPTLLDAIDKQLKFLKDANAAVCVVGVSTKLPSDKKNNRDGNAKLKQLADKYDFKYAGGFSETDSEDLHPISSANYWKSNILPNLPPAPNKNAPDNIGDGGAVQEEVKKEEVKKEKSIFPIMVEGSYTAKSCEELIGFQSYKLKLPDGQIGDVKLGAMDDIIMAKLEEIYKMGYNPRPTEVVVKVSSDTQPGAGTINWSVKIEESTDNKAWVGFTSRGTSCHKNGAEAKKAYIANPALQPDAIKKYLLDTFGGNAAPTDKKDDVAFILKVGMTGLGTYQDSAHDQTFVVTKITDLKCDITEVEFKNKAGQSVYGYYKPSEKEKSTISFRKFGEGVQSQKACDEFIKFNDFGKLTFSEAPVVDNSVISAFNITAGMVAFATDGKNYVVISLTNFSCGIVRVELKRNDGVLDYGYYRPTGKETDTIELKGYPNIKIGESSVCANFDKFDSFGTLKFGNVNSLSNNKLKVGMTGEGYINDEAAGEKYTINVINNLNCGITEVEFKRVAVAGSALDGKLAYAYYKPVPSDNNIISFQALGDGVNKSTNPCVEFSTFLNFGSLKFDINLFDTPVENATKTATTTDVTQTNATTATGNGNLVKIKNAKGEDYSETQITLEKINDQIYENKGHAKNNIPHAFRQVFFRYTKEIGWPPTDKKADTPLTDEQKLALEKEKERAEGSNLPMTVSRPTSKWVFPPELTFGHPANRDIDIFHIFIGDEQEGVGDNMSDFEYEDYDILDEEYREAEAVIVESDDGLITWSVGDFMEVVIMAEQREPSVVQPEPEPSVLKPESSVIESPGKIDLNKFNGTGYDPLKKIIFQGESSSGGYDACYPSTTFKKKYGGGSITSMQTKIIDVQNKLGGAYSDVAIGRYQNLARYIVDRAKSVGLNPKNDLYNEVNQEKMGEKLIDMAIGNYINGKNSGGKQNLIDAIQGFGQKWASIPVIHSAVKVGKNWVTVWDKTVGDVDTGGGSMAYYTNKANRYGKATGGKTIADVVISLLKARKNLAPNKKPSFIPNYAKGIW